MPTEKRAIELFHNPIAVEFFLFFKQKNEDEQIEKLARILGLIWDRSDLFKPDIRPDGLVEKVLIPLSLLLEPKLKENLRAQMQKSEKTKNEVELGRLDKDSYISLYRKLVPSLK